MISTAAYERAKDTLGRAAKDYGVLWNVSDPDFGKPHRVRAAFRYFGILLGTSEKAAEELWEAVKDDVVREYQAEKREEVVKKVTFKRSVTQTTIERYCVRMPLHPPTKCDDIEVLEKRKCQATMEEYFEKKPQN